MQHFRKHYDERGFKCAVCAKGFYKSGHLSDHMRIHTGEKPFGCNICLRQFTQKSAMDLRKPLIIGSVESVVFVSDKVAVLQAVQLPPGWPNQSPDDDNTSGSANGVQAAATGIDQAAHASLQPGANVALYASKRQLHFCTLCPYTTIFTNSMVRHMRTHTGEKPFKCGVCPRTFTQKHHAREHMRTHTGVAPFPCNCVLHVNISANVNCVTT
ncbi:hypothetical protein HPB49_003034 [Dermacentor silvarum]|uniref:Uncharacterized protein n=1 Tax=Dermacentor silvarum TaxID=543639 RepID=A0ACB8DML5_DERSI|nr:hypothetical protein HPB49_003034 [Dermacentor silvarum]